MKNKIILAAIYAATILAAFVCTGCANLQSNINNGITTLSKDANIVGQDLTKGGQAVVAAGGDAVTAGTDMIKVGGVIVTNTTPTPAPAASTGT